MFYYVYVIKSTSRQYTYVGSTADLKRRFDEHQKGKVFSTSVKRPFKLVYYEASLSKKDALRREKYLKTTYGKRFIGQRIKSYLTG